MEVAVNPITRREKYPHRREGSGRQTTVRSFDLLQDPTVGRRTGVRVKANVRLGADGFEDVEEFWPDGENVTPPGHGAGSGAGAGGKRMGGAASAATPRSARASARTDALRESRDTGATPSRRDSALTSGATPAAAAAAAAAAATPAGAAATSVSKAPASSVLRSRPRARVSFPQATPKESPAGASAAALRSRSATATPDAADAAGMPPAHADEFSFHDDVAAGAASRVSDVRTPEAGSGGKAARRATRSHTPQAESPAGHPSAAAAAAAAGAAAAASAATPVTAATTATAATTKTASPVMHTPAHHFGGGDDNSVGGAGMDDDPSYNDAPLGTPTDGSSSRKPPAKQKQQKQQQQKRPRVVASDSGSDDGGDGDGGAAVEKAAKGKRARVSGKAAAASPAAAVSDSDGDANDEDAAAARARTRVPSSARKAVAARKSAAAHDDGDDASDGASGDASDDDFDHAGEDAEEGERVPLTPGNAVIPEGYDMRKLRKSLKPQPPLDSAAVRRSTRRRWEPLKAWESERVVYTEEGALRAEKAGVLTPDLEDNRRKRAYRKKTEGSGKTTRRVKKATASNDSDDGVEAIKMAPLSPVPGFKESVDTKIEYIPVGSASPLRVAVMRRAEQMSFQQLPGYEGDPALAPTAAAAFNCPEFISGIVNLKPSVAKQEESTSSATQVFFISACQPRSLEVCIHKRRFLCSPGDHFFVPRMTRYSLRNHSKTATATIHFVILSEPAQ